MPKLEVLLPWLWVHEVDVKYPNRDEHPPPPSLGQSWLCPCSPMAMAACCCTGFVKVDGNGNRKARRIQGRGDSICGRVKARAYVGSRRKTGAFDLQCKVDECNGKPSRNLECIRPRGKRQTGATWQSYPYHQPTVCDYVRHWIRLRTAQISRSDDVRLSVT